MDFGSDYYSHFTSPIRRYSDLYTHRTISKYLEGIYDFGNIVELESVAEHISDTERVAQKMEREYDKIKIAEYVEGFVGSKFKGRVSGKIGKGIFVDIGKEIEGLVTNEEILKKDKLKEEYTIGDIVDVVVKNVNLDSGEIDLMLFLV